MKKLLCRVLSRALGSFAVSLWILSIAGTASATPFGGDSHRFSNFSLFSASQFPGFSGSTTSIGSSGYTGVGFGRFDFVWTTGPDDGPGSTNRDRLIHVVREHAQHFRIPKHRRDPAPAIPEPSAAWIFAAGLAVAGWRRRS